MKVPVPDQLWSTANTLPYKGRNYSSPGDRKKEKGSKDVNVDLSQELQVTS